MRRMAETCTSYSYSPDSSEGINAESFHNPQTPQQTTTEAQI